jgi:muconolactone delta-isomerase
MEFLVEFKLTIPQDADPADVDARRQAETAASAQLARAGQLVRLWTVSRSPGRWRGIGLYRADSESEMEALVLALPLHDWMQVTVTALEAHPNDPTPAPGSDLAARPGG